MVGWFILACAVLALAMAMLRPPQNRRVPYRRAEEQAPDELRTAQRIALPGQIAMHRPLALHGKPDHVYLLKDGRLLIREDKSSNKDLATAIIQASVYAAILRHNPPSTLRGCEVARHGWVRQGRPDRGAVRYVRIDLLGDAELARLIHVYRALEHGWNATRTADRATCQHRCAFYKVHCEGSKAAHRGRG